MSLSVSIQFVSSSVRVTSVKFHKRLLLPENQTHRSDQVYLGLIKTTLYEMTEVFLVERVKIERRFDFEYAHAVDDYDGGKNDLL